MENLNKISLLHKDLSSHIVYSKLGDLRSLKIFMKWHSFAVFDFMSLLKCLQVEITSVTIPWKPSHYPKDLVRFINEIVLGEESDENAYEGYNDHFSMYLNAMREVGADTSEIDNLIKYDSLKTLPEEIRDFVEFNLSLSMSKEFHCVAAAFFWGRENLIPSIFEPIVKELKSSSTRAPELLYYLERHIELDGDSHGDLARKCVDILCDGDSNKLEEAHQTAITSLVLRKRMWDFIATEIEKSSQTRPQSLL